MTETIQTTETQNKVLANPLVYVGCYTQKGDNRR